MLDLTNYLHGIEFSTFEYWFIRKDFTRFEVLIQECESWRSVGYVDQDDSRSGIVEVLALDLTYMKDPDVVARICEDFRKYKKRPEYLVGMDISQKDVIYTTDLYDKLLIGCRFIEAFQRAGKNPDDYYRSAHRAIEWLRTTDFYTAPASTRYHDSQPTGLISHSLNVAANMVRLHCLDKFKDIPIEDAILVALVHDWCKIGLYESYNRNVKDETGKWTTKMEYKVKESPLTCLGHGVSSMFLAQKFFNLSLDQAVAIRWHMGFCRVADSDMNELQQANENYPLVHMLQFADQLSITKYR